MWKAWHWLKRFRLRNWSKVNIESVLIATGQNLKRLLRRWCLGATMAAGAVGTLSAPAATIQSCFQW
jgi:hypothetical protein